MDFLNTSTPKKQQLFENNRTNFMFKILLLIFATNILTVVIFIHYSNSPSPAAGAATATAQQEEKTISHIQSLQNELKLSISLNQHLISMLDKSVPHHNPDAGGLRYADLIADLSEETKLALGFHKLPLGFSPQSGAEEIMSSYGSGCLNLKQDLESFMSYEIGGECLVDEVGAQKLMLRGCEPLPRRRCHPKSPSNYVEPTPLPESLWAIPPDTSIVWDPYTCKNYSCLTHRGLHPGTYDCKDCFYLGGRESGRWLYDYGLDYSMDRVLETKPPGTIRIGLDIGGGSGTFAARMRERNVTIITTSMNFDGPFNSFISSRGLLSIHVTLSQRFPFFENTLDIVHSMHVLSNWLPPTMLEFILYDIYRILRPGGLFWLDHFFCVGKELNGTFAPMFERVGYRKLKWDTGRKLDRGVELNEWYISGLFEKPMT